MTKNNTPPREMVKYYGVFLLTFGIIMTFVLINPILTGLGILIAFTIDILILKGWRKITDKLKMYREFEKEINMLKS